MISYMRLLTHIATLPDSADVLTLHPREESTQSDRSLNATIQCDNPAELSLDNDRVIVTESTKTLRGVKPNDIRPARKLDAAFVSCTPGHHQYGTATKNPLTNKFEYGWNEIIVPVELKCSRNETTQARKAILHYVREIFGAQATRRRVLAFSLCGRQYSVYHSDRAGTLISPPCDIETIEGATFFVESILFFLFSSDANIGFDPSLSFDSKGSLTTTLQAADGPVINIRLEKVLRNSPGITGRGTVCWEATETDRGVPLVLKYSWPYQTQFTEGYYLKIAKDIPGIVNIWYEANIFIDGDQDSIKATIRNNLQTSVGSNSQEGGASTDRYRTCLLLLEQGEPLYDASSLDILVNALKSCLDSHWKLYKQGIMHRDINLNNILIGKRSPGLLIDLDQAIPLNRDAPSGAPDRTGSKFRAIKRLAQQEDPNDRYREDIEPFYWVTLFVAVCYDGPKREKVLKDFQVERWSYEDDFALSGVKTQFTSKKGLTHEIEEHFSPHFKPLRSIMHAMRKALFDEKHASDEACYKSVRGALENKLDELD